ncbi:exported hypothetical protein [Cupriavidus taiwanensis]|uniref:Uncharacterized protein n=1 Tax=Cupriavidus taiwanensis TaxID=164546 RepID=A0A375J7G0_9BURK|nr:exported hypothetical protein [Cupriavidus taiwanensis]
MPCLRCATPLGPLAIGLTPINSTFAAETRFENRQPLRAQRLYEVTAIGGGNDGLIKTGARDEKENHDDIAYRRRGSLCVRLCSEDPRSLYRWGQGRDAGSIHRGGKVRHSRSLYRWCKVRHVRSVH